MNRLLRRPLVLVGAALLAAVTGTTIAAAAGVRLNVSASAPEGIWLVSEVNRPIARGDIVMVCPPRSRLVESLRDAGEIPAEWGVFGWLGQRGCAAGTVPFLKPVVAVAGDTVSVSREGITVNGHTIRNSRSADFVLGVPATAVGSSTVADDEIWVVSSYATNSFDSRYFGAVSTSDVRRFARPVWVIGNVTDIYTVEETH